MGGGRFISGEIMSEIQTILKDVFGFDTFRSGQQKVIEIITGGKSSAAIFPTGAGKSLCYQLPALLEHGMTLVISPLLSLMKDQIDSLNAGNITAAKLDSGMSAEEYKNTLAAARQGHLKILMIAVERFKNERFRTQLRQMNVSLIVVDEAHCISEWGHNFRPDYLKIPLYAGEFNIKKVLLLTATATPRVIDDMCEKFAIEREHVVKTGFYRKNLFLDVDPVIEPEKDTRLKAVLSAEPAGPAVVYVTLQRTAERVARMLSQNNMAAEAYHAGMKNDQREAVQNRFMENKTDIVVATIAFGMGIDKEDIRKIVHYDLPKSIESYSQEIGRAGRDGRPSFCCVLANKNSIPVLENFIYGDTPYTDNIRIVLNQIVQTPGNEFQVKAYQLSRMSDIRLLPLKTLLVYLEMLKIISPKYTFFESYAFLYLTSADTIISHFTGERKQFVKTILEHSTTAVKWVNVDIEQIMLQTGSNRQRILTALEYFHEKGWIDLQPKSGVEVFDILDSSFDVDSTAKKLGKLFLEKEKKDIARLHATIGLFESGRCLARDLSDYFGEKLDSECGHCSVCKGRSPVRLPRQELPALDNFNYDALTRDLLEAAEPPLPVYLITRFLCGISTPLLVYYKAKKLAGFGRLEAYPYKIVEKWVHSHQNT